MVIPILLMDAMDSAKSNKVGNAPLMNLEEDQDVSENNHLNVEMVWLKKVSNAMMDMPIQMMDVIIIARLNKVGFVLIPQAIASIHILIYVEML